MIVLVQLSLLTTSLTHIHLLLADNDTMLLSMQGSHKPGIVREFCKPGKVREFEISSGNFFITCHMVHDLLIDEFVFVCNV